MLRYWLTQAGNATARRLYDRVAVQTDFIKYDRRAITFKCAPMASSGAAIKKKILTGL